MLRLHSYRVNDIYGFGVVVSDKFFRLLDLFRISFERYQELACLASRFISDRFIF